MRIAAIAIACGTLGGCVTSASDEIPPVETVTVQGTYNQVASCAYVRIAERAEPSVAKADLSDETRLFATAGGIRLWELTFRPAGKAQTNVAMTKAQTAMGPIVVGRLMPIVRECGM